MSIAERNRNVRRLLLVPTPIHEEAYQVSQMRNIVEYPLGYLLTKEAVRALIVDGVDVTIKHPEDSLDLGDLR